MEASGTWETAELARLLWDVGVSLQVAGLTEERLGGRGHQEKLLG